MIKLVPGQPKWLASLIILAVVTLLIGGCMPANQPPVTFGVAANHPPVIDSLTAEQRVRKATTSTIECIASDPDGDELSYTWLVNGGSISRKGSVATWVAPNAYGTYTITVTVTDAKGGQAIKTIDIVVTCCL